MSEVTQIIRQVETGDLAAAEQLLPLVYAELRKLAAARLAQESFDHTLEATALVHEAYVRLVDDNEGQCWDSRGHFFAAAAEAMRRILIESARRRAADKNNGGRRQADVYELDPAGAERTVDLLELDEALDRLAAGHPRTAELVKLRYFAGLTQSEAARCLGISVATADRDWAYAKAWLYRALSEQ